MVGTVLGTRNRMVPKHPLALKTVIKGNMVSYVNMIHTKKSQVLVAMVASGMGNYLPTLKIGKVSSQESVT